MRLLRLLVLSGLFCLHLTAEEHSPTEKFHRQLDAAEKEYRQSLAVQLKEATKVELHWVKFPRDWKQWRPIQPAQHQPPTADFDPFAKPTSVQHSGQPTNPPVHGSIQKVELEKGVREELLRILSRDLGHESVTMFACGHSPIYAVKIWKGDEVIFLQSFGGSCRNFSFHYPDQIGRPGRHHLIMMSDDLHDLLPELLPIPQNGLHKTEVEAPADDTDPSKVE